MQRAAQRGGRHVPARLVAVDEDGRCAELADRIRGRDEGEARAEDEVARLHAERDQPEVDRSGARRGRAAVHLRTIGRKARGHLALERVDIRPKRRDPVGAEGLLDEVSLRARKVRRREEDLLRFVGRHGVEERGHGVAIGGSRRQGDPRLREAAAAKDLSAILARFQETGAREETRTRATSDPCHFRPVPLQTRAARVSLGTRWYPPVPSHSMRSAPQVGDRYGEQAVAKADRDFSVVQHHAACEPLAGRLAQPAQATEVGGVHRG